MILVDFPPRDSSVPERRLENSTLVTRRLISVYGYNMFRTLLRVKRWNNNVAVYSPLLSSTPITVRLFWPSQRINLAASRYQCPFHLLRIFLRVSA